MKKPTKLTSIKVLPELYQEFKSAVSGTGLNLQNTVHRVMYLMITDQEFLDRIKKEKSLYINSGSYY